MLYGLIGERLGHSYSAEIHKTVTGLPYELKEISSEKLAEWMTNRQFSGINVTIPYKSAVIPFLDEISEAAKQIGAVNTVVNRGGKLFGYNTDFAGMTALIRKAGLSLQNRKVLILGNGGTAKTARAVAESLEASQIITVSRHSSAQTVSYEQAKQKYSDAEIIINTTPVGMYPNEGAIPLELSAFPFVSGVVDAVYHPLRTDFVLSARERAVCAVGGLYMLCAQAVAAMRLFHPEKPFPDTVTDEIYIKIKQQKENIVLIGMPTSGKTTVGRLLAESTGKAFLDSDQEIERQIGAIPDYIKSNGEAAFRAVERRVIAELSKKDGAVIATGGGAVLDPDNIHALKRNGTVYFIDRSLENLAALPDRPLSSDRDHLAKLFETRYPIYNAAADRSVDGNGSPEAVAKEILQQFSKDFSL